MMGRRPRTIQRYRGQRRTGVVPVIALVILLMLSFAIAGSFSSFTESMFDDLIGETDRTLNTDADVKDLSCFDDGGNLAVRLTLLNDGKRDIDASTVHLFVRDTSDQALVHGQTMRPSEPKVIERSTIWGPRTFVLDYAFEPDETYDVEVVFARANSFSIRDTCQS